MNNIAIIGSSPVSLIYSILLSKLKISSTIFCGHNFGGSWKNSKLLNYEIPISTHIFMHSNGLKKTFDEIGYSPNNWAIKPFLIDNQYNFLSNFGNNNHSRLGAPILNDCIINFLINKIKNEKNISLKKNTIIDKLIFNKIKDNSNSQNSFSGVIMTCGNRLELFIDEKKIDYESKLFEVHSLSIIAFSKNEAKSCFIHIEGDNTLLREIQSIPLRKDNLLINCKISKLGRGFFIDKIIEEVKSLFKKLFKVDLEIIKFQSNIYNNWRFCYSFDANRFNEIPLLIPGVNNIKDNNMRHIIKNSQDLSKLFSDYDLIIKNTLDKLSNKKYDCRIKIK